MDIKLKNHLLQGKEVKQPGDILKISDEKGEKLIKKGYAVKVDSQDTAESNDESQTSETTETADVEVDKEDTKTTKSKAKNKK